MNIEIKLDKDFERFLESMKVKYGERMLELNGLSEKQLNHTEFIDYFIDKNKNTADTSIDANANVGHKDVTTLENEMAKPHLKLLALNKIFSEIKKIYGLRQAKKWAEEEWNGAFYLHDAYSSTLKSYCYKGENLLTIKYKGKTSTLSFMDLYNLLDEPEVYDISIEQEAKFPQDLYVLDTEFNSDKLFYSKVYRVVKHENNKEMRVLKYSNGLSQIVTEDHPVIINGGEIPAKDLQIGQEVWTINTGVKFTNSINEITTIRSSERQPKNIFGKIKLTKELGWLVGFLLAEGSVSKYSIQVKQNYGPIYDKFLSILKSCDIEYSFMHGTKEEVMLLSNIITKWIKDIFGGQHAESKSLPEDFIHYNSDFLDGIVAGLIDGDGTFNGKYKNSCQIRIVSERLLRQISEYLQSKNITVRDRVPYLYNSKNNFIVSKFPVYGITFNLNSSEYFKYLESIKIKQYLQFSPRVKKGNFSNKQYTCGYNIAKVISNTLFIDYCDTVYDITTETGHFICNNVLSHNCFAYDLKPIVDKGLFFVKNFNAQPPKHLYTYTNFVGETVSWLSNRTSGAVGLPNFLVYSFYFWKKDCAEGYAIKDAEYYRDQQFQDIIYKLNQPYLRVTQSAFTNFSIFDRSYYEALFGGLIFPDGSFAIDYVDEFMDYQKAFMDKVSEIRSQNMMTYPVLSYCLLRVNGKFEDEDFAKWCCEHNMKWADSNFFISSDVTSLSNCCRLISNVDNLGFFNSIGGTALEVGSVKVNTINLARIAYETKDRKKYLEKLKDRVITCVKTLHVVRHIIERNIDKGLLPNYSLGLIHLKSQYNTIGINALWEAVKYLGGTQVDEFNNVSYTEDGIKFAEQILNTIKDTKDAFIAEQKLDYQINIEQVPGERCAVIFQEKDKELYDDGCYDLPLYGNQWIPLGAKTTIYNKLSCSAGLDKACSGGSIAHINLDTPLNNFDMAWNLLNKIADMEVPYFAFCTRISACEQNHGFYGDTCPICGKPKKTTYQRIVGFLTPEINYSKERKAEFKLRDWFTLANMEEL